MAAIRLRSLHKSYGQRPALTDIDLDIERGEVFGYLGPNGAGKTTTIRILLGLLRPSAGSAEVVGLDSWRDAIGVHARTGYVAGEPGFWERLTGFETVTYLARLRDAPAQVAAARDLAERLGLDLDRQVRTLSKGNRQKLAIIQAFMGSPDVLVLDEPTTGLDPLVQQEFHHLVRESTARGATVLLSSHLLDDVQRTADRVGIIRDGRLVTVERLDDLRAKAIHHLTARLDGPFDRSAFAAVPGIRELHFERGSIDCRVPAASLDQIIKLLARSHVNDVSITEADLEEMFLSYYAAEGSVDAA